MINLKLNVKYLDDTSAEVKTRPSSEVAFERRFDIAIVEALNTASFKLEWMYFLAWHASKTATEFDAWLDTVEEIEIVDSDSPDPTAAAVSTT